MDNRLYVGNNENSKLGHTTVVKKNNGSSDWNSNNIGDMEVTENVFLKEQILKAL